MLFENEKVTTSEDIDDTPNYGLEYCPGGCSTALVLSLVGCLSASTAMQDAASRTVPMTQDRQAR